MLRINQLSISAHHTDKELEDRLVKYLGVTYKQIKVYAIIRKSLDARKKDDIKYSYIIDVELIDDKTEAKVLKELVKKKKDVCKFIPKPYVTPDKGSIRLNERPVIVGLGPAGLFAGLTLARAGYNPLIIERGDEAVKRKEKVEAYWKGAPLDVDSNVSFGEGGAGTFSDGKLNTLVKDESGRNFEVLKTFVDFGADEEILYLQKPHIGTDRLIDIVSSMRREIIRLGGEVRFNAQMTDVIIEGDKLKAIVTKGNKRIDTSVLILSIGHSSRDTFYMLKDRNLDMEAKSFALGVRIQHPQRMIDEAMFGVKEAEYLSPASYKLTGRSAAGRGVYSFCMCPGGYVVDASTEDGMIAVNGMSYHGRDSESANSAIIVQVNPEDFGDLKNPLAGVEYQRRIEKLAYRYTDGRIPVQLLGDFIDKRNSLSYGDVVPCFKGRTQFARLDELLPEYISESLKDVMPDFDRKIKGFARADAILAGVESRTSSPVRICRDLELNSNIKGIYPCGEGAGYAGGITSAAMDGIKVADAVISKYCC